MKCTLTHCEDAHTVDCCFVHAFVVAVVEWPHDHLIEVERYVVDVAFGQVFVQRRRATTFVRLRHTTVDVRVECTCRRFLVPTIDV